ncbi:hypothetical protein EDD18DRAFT_1366405 [Armillaria luteobubalina]|uniref:Zn(2)-C6 fungal-type domain-containing protein n=1 Tax=Armillaria luteobubalina TaxID=153913 RepID=A0AA39P390_9AGAR|nr:hypothetical protein EDD18DRAFT_1366405 [Armillaria luteobubalina]
MAQSEQSADPSQAIDTTASTDASGSTEPQQPMAFQRSIARGKFYAGLESLSQLQEAPPQPHWTSARIDQWVREAKKLWRVEFEFLQLLVDFPDERIDGATAEYNELVARARQYKIRVFPLPVSETPVVETTPIPLATSQNTAAPPSSVAGSAAPIPTKTAPTTTTTATPSAGLIPKPTTTLSQVPSTSRSTSAYSTVPPKDPANASSTEPQRPKLTLLSPRPPATTQDSIFSLDPTSPLHLASTKVGALPPSSTPGVRRLQGPASIPPPAPPARPISPPSPSAPTPLTALDLGPLQAGSVTSSFRIRTPLFFPGTDDEDEPPTPRANDKGKDKEIILGTDEDEVDFQGQFDSFETMDVDDDDDGSPPPTNIAWRFRSPIPAGPSPITVSEVRSRLSIHQADPNSALFKLLGAPPVAKPKKGSQRKPKFNNPPPASNDSAAEGTVKASRSSKKTTKASKGKAVGEVSKGEVVATKAIRPRGPSRLRAPPATIGIQIGGFGEEVPADYKAVKNGLKSIGVLVVSKDFGDFVEVDKALWNKKVAPFIGEQYVKQCDQCYRKKTQCRKFLTNSIICIQCHYTKLPCLVNGTKALNPLAHYRPKEYKSINAFESAMTTLSQHVDALEDVVINFMAGVDALSHLQGVRAQIGQLREGLSIDTQVEDVVDEENDEGFGADEVSEGEPGPSKKRKRSGK